MSREDSGCAVCGKRQSVALRVCAQCSLDTGAALTEILRDVDTLENRLRPSAGERLGGRSVPTSRPPLVIHILSLLGPDAPDDPVAATAEQSGSPSITALLCGWQRDWASTLPELPPLHQVPPPTRKGLLPPGHDSVWYRNLYSTVSWLRANQRHAEQHHPGIEEYCREVIAMRDRIRRAIDSNPHSRMIGRCPTTLDDGTRCGARLYVTPDAYVIVCTGCAVRRERPAWRVLGEAMAQADRESAA